MTTPKTTPAAKTNTDLSNIPADVATLMELESESKETLQELTTFPEEPFLKLEVNDEITAFVTGIKYLPNQFFKPTEPESKHNCKQKAHVQLDVLVRDDKSVPSTKPHLCNAVMLVNFAENFAKDHPDVLKYALKIHVYDQETNSNGTFLKMKFYTPAF